MDTETFIEYSKKYEDFIKEIGIEPEKYFLQEYLQMPYSLKIINNPRGY